jgi:hypothetical protein
MTVYNEAEFVEYAIRACLPYVDDLVIVEGAYQETIRCGAEPRSTDGTCYIAQKYLFPSGSHMGEIDPYRGDNPHEKEYWEMFEQSSSSKVWYIEANEETDKDQRNVGLEKIKELNPDGWVLIIDGDEVYTKENFMMIRNIMKTMESQDKRGAYFKSLTFVNDFDHFTEQEFPRLFRVTPGCTFVNDNYMTWEDTGWHLGSVLKIPYLRYHHYAFVKGKERFELKKKWWETRFEEPFDYGWHVNEDGEIDDPNHKILPYGGKHPEILKDHPRIKDA